MAGWLAHGICLPCGAFSGLGPDAAQRGSASMAHDFEIRFARSAGLAGLLEAPANPFRWKGGGRLSVDAQGIRIEARRAFKWFGASSRRITAHQLTEAYREGEAVRLEFNTRATRSTLSFWARTASDAARIVQLLPTVRTVELQDELARKFRLDRPLVGAALAIFVALAVAVALQSTPGIMSSGQEPALPATSTATAVTSIYPIESTPLTDVNDEKRVTPAALRTAATPESRGPGSESQAASLSPVNYGVAAPDEAQQQDGAGASTRETAFDRLRSDASLVTALQADLNALHASCVEGRSCSANQWWEFTVRLYQVDAVFPRREDYATVSRGWRGYLDGGPSADFDRALAMKIMRNPQSRGD